MNEFKREKRYEIAKCSDVDKYLSDSEMSQLCELLDKISFGRQQDNRGILKAVVIESDWPEYEPTWQAIEARMTQEAKQLKEQG